MSNLVFVKSVFSQTWALIPSLHSAVAKRIRSPRLDVKVVGSNPSITNQLPYLAALC